VTNPPLVSVVVPCYNSASLLLECVPTILAQDYANFELLIMDNCSSDNTPEALRLFHDPRLKHVRNESNIGHLRNFNKGIGLSHGKYVLLVAADDFLVDYALLSRYVDMMERNPDAGYVFCPAVDEKRQLLPFTNLGSADHVWNGRRFLRELLWQNRLVMSAVMVRKACYLQTSVFPLDLPYAADWYLWLILALHYKVAYLARPMIFWRVHEQSLTTSFLSTGAAAGLWEDIEVLWRISRQAALGGAASLARTCKASIAFRVATILASEPRSDSRDPLRETKFEDMLACRADSAKDAADMKAQVYAFLADQLAACGDLLGAAANYRRSLALRPRWLKTWAKCALFHCGAHGARAKQIYAAMRSRQLG